MPSATDTTARLNSAVLAELDFTDTEDFDDAMRGFVATVDDATVLDHTRSIMEAGGSGVIFGRNVWQREWDDALKIIGEIKETLLASVKRTP